MQRLRRTIGGLIAAGLLFACTEYTGPAGSGSGLQITPLFNVSSRELTPGVLTICKETPEGTSGHFQIDVFIFYPDGSRANAEISLNSGECQQVTNFHTDPTITAIENLVNGDPGWTLLGVTRITPTGSQEWPDRGSPEDPAVCTLDQDNGCTLVFHNVPNTPPGKTFSIGPSSMEGAILIANGDWVNGGYSFKFKDGAHAATNFSVHATVSITGPCIGGGPATDNLTFALNDATYAVAAGNTNWLPTGDANSVLSWQGSVQATGVCGGVGKLDARHGAVFTATVSQNPPTGSLVNFRFKYRDPRAKGKPNTNCLDTSDPNRNRADVCGASWSQTVTDP